MSRIFDTNEFNKGKNDNQFVNNFKSSLVFPSDLSDKNFFPEAIKFSIYDREGVDFDAVVNESSNAYQVESQKQKKINNDIIAVNEKIQRDAGSNISAEILKTTDANIAGARNRINQGLDIGLSLGKGIEAGLESAVRQKTQPKSPTQRHIQSIYLNMPPTVSFAEGVEWQGSDLGVIGGVLKGEGAEAVKSGALGAAGAVLGGAAGGLVSKILGGSGAIGATIAGAVGGDLVQGGIESTFNVKANPYKEQTFQGVGFRPFEFQFVLRARNQVESSDIKKIVNAFRAYSKPSFKTAGKSGVFAYPKEFRIEFLTNDDGEYKTNKFIPQIKYCICTSVATNFTGSGSWKSFESGAPTDVQLSLSFQETEIITQEDVMGETEVGRFKNEEGYF